MSCRKIISSAKVLHVKTIWDAHSEAKLHINFYVYENQMYKMIPLSNLFPYLVITGTM